MQVMDYSKYLANDPEIQRLTKDSFFYLILQRPILTFENISISQTTLNFEIHQKQNIQKLKCKLPFIQKEMFSKDDKRSLEFLSNNDTVWNEIGELYEIQNIKCFKVVNKDLNFIKLLTPEWIIRDHYNDNISIEIEGNILDFLNYKIHYIGTATKQKITDRLNSHSNLQKILSEETSIQKGDLNSLELCIMFFEIQGNSQYSLLTSKDLEKERNDMVKLFQGGFADDEKMVFQDAEKAFVQYIKPEYNTIQFKSYPKKNDLLKRKGYKFITYEFTDPIKLNFKNGTMDCSKGDLILVTENEKARIVTFKEPDHNTV